MPAFLCCLAILLKQHPSKQRWTTARDFRTIGVYTLIARVHGHDRVIDNLESALAGMYPIAFNFLETSKDVDIYLGNDRRDTAIDRLRKGSVVNNYKLEIDPLP